MKFPAVYSSLSTNIVYVDALPLCVCGNSCFGSKTAAGGKIRWWSHRKMQRRDPGDGRVWEAPSGRSGSFWSSQRRESQIFLCSLQLARHPQSRQTGRKKRKNEPGKDGTVAARVSCGRALRAWRGMNSHRRRHSGLKQRNYSNWDKTNLRQP